MTNILEYKLLTSKRDDEENFSVGVNHFDSEMERGKYNLEEFLTEPLNLILALCALGKMHLRVANFLVNLEFNFKSHILLI